MSVVAQGVWVPVRRWFRTMATASCTVKPLAAEARSVVSAAEVAVRYGQHPPHEGEHAATRTASSGDPMINDTPAWHPAPAIRRSPVHGIDEIKGTRA